MVATSDRLADRLPPQNRDAERAVLGAIIRDPETVHAVQSIITADSFYYDPHQRIYRALCDLAGEGKPVELVSLYDLLRQRKQLEDVGGKDYLVELWEAVPTGVNAEYHARLVRDAALVRGLIHASNEILRDAYDHTSSADELVAAAERKVLAVADGSPHDREALCAADLTRDAGIRLDDRASRGGPDGLLTGFGSLDDVLGGLKPGQMIVVGARPGAGKTALALAVATKLAARGVPAYFASVEMPAAEITDRILSARSGVPLRSLQRGDIHGDAAERIAEASAKFAGEPFYLDDSPDLTAARLGAAVRRMVRRRGVALVAVDYLQLLTPENPRENRTQQVGLLARRVKQMARACGVPVLLLCQLNREVEGRPDAKPRLSDLRESGEIEQHADAVVLLAPHRGQADDAAVWLVDAVIAKNRNGPVAEVRLAYRRALTRFENAPH